jgi:uncharacterized protein (DUF2236 family)
MVAMDRHRERIRDRLRASSIRRAGPGSISWKINRSWFVLAGWGPAILLQLAHPLVAAGVGQHSQFRGSLRNGLRRFWATVTAMRAITFGTDDEMVDAVARIAAVHDRVRGQLSSAVGVHQAGARYSAHDADLQRWVHTTLLYAIPSTYARVVGPLTDDDRDRYCAEATIMEPLMGLPDGSLPRTWSDVQQSVAAMVDGPTLAISDESRALAHAVLYPPHWWLLFPLFRPVQLLTIALLPPPLREKYGLPWTPRHVRALARWTRLARLVGRWL